MTRNIVQFEIGPGLYAMDIGFVREIVEMHPVTSLPGGKSCILGVINLRGDITTIVSINSFLGLNGESGKPPEKIIVMAPESTGGMNIGIAVHEVHMVIQVDDSDIDPISGMLASGSGSYIKGIIKTRGEGKTRQDGPDEGQRLMVYLDIPKILQDLQMTSLPVQGPV